MGEMLQNTLVLEESLCLNGHLLAVCAVNISNPSQLCSLLFCTALPTAVGRQCWAGAAGGFAQGTN